ncbi:MAG: ABC transporter ATP-binding protein [Atopobiaceae bacterium]
MSTTTENAPQEQANAPLEASQILGRPAIPAEDAPVVIDVDHVQMIFNMASEDLGSLKEYFIKLARHELFFKEFHALEDISFKVHKGEAFGLVGTNGSGKSTMLKIIAGVLEPSRGSVTVRGSIAPLIELGAGFDMELTAKENIYLNGALLGYSREFIDDKFDDIVEFAELRDFLDMPLKNYSSGMVARIAFAIATITVPDVLIVDETLSVGDFLFQEKCMRRIRELVETNNCTVLLVSHDISLVEQICDRVCWIEKGHERILGPTDEVCAAYKALGA